MWKEVGPFRNRAGLTAALDRIRAMQADELPRVPTSRDTAFAIELTEWHELRAALLVAEAVTVAALAREESRGAHQRDDFPETSEKFQSNQEVFERTGTLISNLPAGWPRVVAHPRLPQIRTCPIKASGSSNNGLAAQRYTL